jgi:hypothetical protein
MLKTGGEQILLVGTVDEIAILFHLSCTILFLVTNETSWQLHNLNVAIHQGRHPIYWFFFFYRQDDLDDFL